MSKQQLTNPGPTPAYWDRVADEAAPSWYLDPLVAAQKREEHLRLIRRWTGDLSPKAVLKTDLFEEAFGQDQILFGLFPRAELVVGADVASRTVGAAKTRCPDNNVRFVVADVQRLPLASGGIDLILSTSTLDHFVSETQFRDAIRELVRVLRPGGALLITLDNLENPLFPLLRWMSRRQWAPFSLGFTVSRTGLNDCLRREGLEVIANDWLIHNPRLISTATFAALRRVLGRHADRPIKGLLGLFAIFERAPLRRFSGCFVAACARKPVCLGT